jgi:hypothetical protein
MKELKELEALLKLEVANFRGVSLDKISAVDGRLVGLTIGTLYGIILGNQKTIDELNKVIARKKEELVK